MQVAGNIASRCTMYSVVDTSSGCSSQSAAPSTAALRWLRSRSQQVTKLSQQRVKQHAVEQMQDQVRALERVRIGWPVARIEQKVNRVSGRPVGSAVPEVM